MKNIIWIICSILVIVGLVALFRSGSPSIDPSFSLDKIHPLDNIKGNASSTVLLVEYSDFQCPACKLYYPVMRELIQEFGDRVAIVYRHFPLTSIHPNAEFAARAAEAAGKQGKFWEMHDMLFEKQDEWNNQSNPESLFVGYARLIGIDEQKFAVDWRSKEVKNFVASQRIHALKSGIQGTPTFFLNGNKLNNPNTADEFKNTIRQALK